MRKEDWKRLFDNDPLRASIEACQEIPQEAKNQMLEHLLTSEEAVNQVMETMCSFEESQKKKLAERLLPEMFKEEGITDIQPMAHTGQTSYVFTAKSPGNKFPGPDLAIRVDKELEVARSREHRLWWDVPHEERAQHGIIAPLLSPKPVLEQCQIIFIGPGPHAIVEPYFAHRTLDELIASKTVVEQGISRTTFTKEELYSIFDQVARTLQFAHNVGWLKGKKYMHSSRLHRDLHPGNILIGTEGVESKVLEVKVGDWGNGVRINDTEGLETTSLGSRHYTSPLVHPCFNPEAKQFSPQEDIFAFGASLYKALTGRVLCFFDPYDEKGEVYDPLGKAHSVLHEDGTLNHERYEQALDDALAHIPESLQGFKKIVRRSLLTRDTARNTNEQSRYQDMGELREELDQLGRPPFHQRVITGLGKHLYSGGKGLALIGALGMLNIGYAMTSVILDQELKRMNLEEQIIHERALYKAENKKEKETIKELLQPKD